MFEAPVGSNVLVAGGGPAGDAAVGCLCAASEFQLFDPLIQIAMKHPNTQAQIEAAGRYESSLMDGFEKD